MTDIQSAGENFFVAKNFVGHYIGYTDILTERKFVWDRTGLSGPYTNWYNHEPNDYGGEDCTEMYSDGSWNDVSCNFVTMAVCKAGKIF